MIKFSIGPRGDVLESTYSHSDSIGRLRDYDSYVRALYWPEKKVIYFRWTGDYGSPECAETHQRAFRTAEKALDRLIALKHVPKRVKVLFWETGFGITEREVKL